VTDSGDVDLAVVTMVMDAVDLERLIPVLSKYVVVSRRQSGCRNIDLCTSVTTPNRVVIIQKWESAVAQRRHFDSPEMVEMAEAAKPLLARPPAIDLLEGLSAHDLA
jgi:quinol monooxygenase YgiN